MGTNGEGDCKQRNDPTSERSHPERHRGFAPFTSRPFASCKDRLVFFLFLFCVPMRAAVLEQQLTSCVSTGSEASTRGTEEDNLTKCCQDSSLKAAALEPVFAGSQTQAPRDAAEDAFADVENVENGIEQKTGKEEAQKVDSDRQATASPG